jgi:hypothetical protein
MASASHWVYSADAWVRRRLLAAAGASRIVTHRPRPLHGRPPSNPGQRSRWQAAPSKSVSQAQRPADALQCPRPAQGAVVVCARPSAVGRSHHAVAVGQARSLQSHAPPPHASTQEHSGVPPPEHRPLPTPPQSFKHRDPSRVGPEARVARPRTGSNVPSTSLCAAPAAKATIAITAPAIMAIQRISRAAGTNTPPNASQHVTARFSTLRCR